MTAYHIPIHYAKAGYVPMLTTVSEGYHESIISNNLNMVMKFLTVVSVIIAVPTVVSSFWGMNVPVPFQENKYGFLIVSIISVIITILAGLYINRKENRRYKNK